MDSDRGMGKVKLWGIIGGVVALVITVVICVILYMLGGADQSALERLRDIAIIFIVLTSVVTVILLAGITAALVFLVFQIKDRVIPLLEEATGTMTRVRGTTNFLTEEAVKPLIEMKSQYARIRRMSKVVTGKDKKPPTVGSI